MKFAKGQRRTRAARGIVCLAVTMLSSTAGLLAPQTAEAGVQLLSFTVGNPPPPEPQPIAGGSPGVSPAGGNVGPIGGAPAAADPHDNDPTVGTMTGQADTVGGSATYSVPIVVPPGRAGMEPSLTINYNSRGSNGILGIGWSLSGLSSIHRCPQNPEQDGQTLGVSYGSTDRLCLEGQRLVVTNAGTYGSSGTEYHTEIDNFAKVTQFGGDIGTGDSACFKVEQKDGRILYYGGLPNTSGCTVSSVNSRVKPTGASRALSWLVERIQDRVGNIQQYSYNATGNSGEVLIDTIAYTGFIDSTGTVTPGDRTVKFAYAARSSSDLSSSYVAGFASLQTQQLQSITTTALGNTVRTYTPAYSTAQYNGRLLLKSLQECGFLNGASKSCHPATTFSYNDSALTFQLASISSATGIPEGSVDAGNGPGPPTTFQTIPDLDGDGVHESMAQVTKSNAVHTYLLQLTGDRKAHPYIELTGTPFAQSLYLEANLDGSGKSALIQTPTADGFVSLNIWKQTRGYVFDTASTTDFTSNFNTLFQSYTTNIPFYVSKAPQGQGQTLFVADMDGDGKPDIVIIQQASTAAFPNGCGPADSNGPHDGVFIYKNNISGTIAGALTASNGFVVPAGPAFCLQRTVNGSFFYEQSIDHVADFDGDGLPDFFLKYGGTDITRLGGFAGIAVMQAGAASATVKTCTQIGLVDDGYNDDDDCNWQHGYFARWMDVNGDGLDDLVLARGRTGSTGANATANQEKWIIRLNKGGTMGPEINTGSSAGLTTDLVPGSGHSLVNYAFRYATAMPTIDADGDGKPDVLIPDSFAVKMCKVVGVPPLGSSEGCPEPDGLLAPASPSMLASNQCAAWACPEDVNAASGHSSMPTNTDSQSGALYPYEWKDKSSNARQLVAFGLHDPGHGGGADFSTYHLSMVKFVQTGDNAFSVSVTTTPIISNLGGNTIDLFGDGLADNLTTVGCENAPQTYTDGQATFQSNNCSVVAQAPYGPTAALPDGTAPCDTTGTPDGSCYFSIHPVLYANINQGTAQKGGSLRPAGAPTMAVRSSAHAVSLNISAPTLPNLLYEAVNGIGDYTQWIYYTLSYPGSQSGITLYTVPSGSGYSDDRNFYFQSSMPVVANMIQPQGNTPSVFGFRTFAYGYDEAMYNRYGRGFLGFRQIITEEGYDDQVNSRFLRTTTLYNQKFPLTSKVDTVTTSVPNSAGTTNTVVKTDASTYICTPSDRTRASCPSVPAVGTVYRPSLDTSTIKSYDLTGTQFGEVDTVNAASTSATSSGWDVYGNLTDQVVAQLDVGTPTFLDNSNADTTKRGHQTTTTNTYAAADTTAWWVNKLTGSVVSGSVYYDASHAFTGDATTLTQKLTTYYDWNTDRTQRSQTVQPNIANQQSMTVYCYPQSSPTTATPCPATTSFGTTSYGLPTRARTCLGYYDTNGVCQADVTTDQAPERIVDFTYTSNGSTSTNGGYFVLTTKRTVDTTAGTTQTTTTTHQPSDGQALVVSDPNGVNLQTTYDQFGRPIQIDHYYGAGTAIDSTVYLAYSTCLDSTTPVPNPNNCTTTLVGEATTDEANAAYRITTVQDGFPTKVTWYDLLNRPIKQGHRGFNGTFDGIATTYDNLGTVSSRSSPYFVGGAPYYTNWTYDALNRPVTKTVDDSDLTTARTKQKTRYTYAGRKTSTTVYDSSLESSLGSGNSCPANASNVCIQMSQGMDSLGHVMQATESPILTAGSTTTTAHTTNYWDDPLGHTVGVSDPDGNTTTAVFNPLGQRTSSSDPDQGTWTFGYDAVGELNSQRDARGVQLTVNKRDALGRLKEQQQVPPTGITGLDTNILFDTWSYDPANGIGEIDTITRSRGTDLKSLNVVWKEAYTYEANTARLSQIATTTTEGSTVSLTSSMTYDAQGRLLTYTYPKGSSTTGLVVKNVYTSYGQLQSLTNNGSTTYWTATGTNEWDHITGETLYGGISGTHADYDSTGQPSSLIWTGKDKFTYGYDSFGNLVKQIKYVGAGSSPTNTEIYSYDPLQRITASTRTNGGTVNYTYSKTGNITSKNDFSTGTGTPYTYGGSGCGPHGVSSVSMPNSLSATYQCDANGNVIRGNTLTNTFSAENRLISASRTYLEPNGAGDNIFCSGFQTSTNTCANSPPSGGSTTWAYDAAGQRSYEHSSAGDRFYGPQGYEQVGAASYHELGPVIVKRQSNVDTVEVVLRDRLGSTLDIVGGQGGSRSFDAFGKARNADLTDRTNGTLNLSDSIHGFTSHTHADDVALVHMNGRVFDPNLGRFLSVDPEIQFPYASQGLNPYSYLRNSPFGGTDPTGQDEDCDGYGKVDCDLTNVSSITVFKQSNGTFIAVAKDNQGNMVTVDQITKVSANGAVTVTGITQEFLQAVANRDSTAIGTTYQLGMGNTSFHGSDYMNHLAADHFGGFAKMAAKGVPYFAVCYASGGACFVLGVSKISSSSGDLSGVFMLAGGAGRPIAEAAAEAEATTATAQGLRSSISAEGSAAAETSATQPKAGIYEFPDQTANQVPYVGQSGNLSSRLSQHAASGRLQPGTERTTEVLGGKTAREIAEHQRIQQITGGVPARLSPKVSNKVDPIGPSRQHLLEDDKK